MGYKVQADQIVANMQKTLDLTKNLRPLMTVMLGTKYDNSGKNIWTLRGTTFNAFQTKTGSINHAAWAPLTAKYFAQKQKKFQGAPSLVRTGGLLKSLQEGNGTEGAVANMSNNELQYGTTKGYAGYLHGGTKRMTARQFMPLDLTGQKLFKSLITKYIAQTMKGQSVKGVQP